MALNLVDRVLETCSAPGTGTVSLLGAVTGYQSFSTVGNGNTCYYTIADQNGANWEVGIGTVATGSPNTLARTTVLSSSNSGSLVNFATGTQNVFLTYPAEKSVFAGNAPGTAGYVLVSGGTGVAATWTAPSSVVGGAAGSNTQVQYNSSGNLAGSANLTFDGTALTLGGNPTLSAGTANGVLYLNGSKVATSGLSFVFDGTNVGIGTSSPAVKLQVNGSLAVGSGQNISWGGAYGAGIPTMAGSASGMDFYPAGSTSGLSMRLDSSGNLGLGVTPPTIYTNRRALVIGGQAVASVYHYAGIGESAYNWYLDGSAAAKYATTSYAGTFEFNNSATGGFAWKLAPSGTAGNAITFTQAMTLDASGRLMVGTTTPNGNFTVYAASGDNYSTVQSTTNSAYAQYTNTSGSCFIGVDNSTGGAFGGGVAYGRYIYSNGAYPLITVVNGSERMRLDSSGNLGLGVTPSAWYSSFKGIDVANAAYYGNINNGTAFVTGNTYINSSLSNIYKTSNYALRYTLATDVGQHIWQTAPSGTAGNAITFTQAMTLDASGNLMVGATSNGGGKFEVKQAVNNQSGIWTYSATTDSNGRFYCDNSVVGIAASYSSTGAYLPIAFLTSATERMRIDSSGNLLVGTTTANARLSVNSAGTTSATYVFVGQNSANTNEMTVRSDGAGYLNSAAWVYGSDATIKENIQYLNPKDCLSLLLNAKPVKFDYIEGQKNNFGYVAQDVQEWLPEAVSENPNGKLGLQDGFINTIGTGAIQALNQLIQEQQAIITDLKARITNLENK